MCKTPFAKRPHTRTGRPCAFQ